MEIFNNTLFDVVLAALIFAFLGGGVVLFAQRRKTNPAPSVWTDILTIINVLRPQLLELIADITTAYDAAKAGYDALEAFVIAEIYNTIQGYEFLSTQEKALITKEVLIAVLRPELMKLYSQKVLEAKAVEQSK